MSPKERKLALELLFATRETFPYVKTKTSNAALKLYVIALDDLSFEQIQAAVIKLINTAKFFPTIAEIRSAADEMTAYANHDCKPDPGEAWAEAIRFAKARSPYDSRPYEFSCDEVREAVNRFGRNSLWELQSKDEGIARAQFMKIYENILTTKKDMAVMQLASEKMGHDIVGLLYGVAKMKELK